MPSSDVGQDRVRPQLQNAPIALPQRISAIVFDVDGTLYSQRRLRFWMAPEFAVRLVVAPSGARVIQVIRAYREAHEMVRARGLQVEGGQT